MNYLQRFTLRGESGGFLHVLDLSNGSTWKSAPESTAFITDFYKTDAEVPDPFIVERVLGSVEGELAPLLESVALERRFPEDPDAQGGLLSFIALQAVRTAAVRELLQTAAMAQATQVLQHWTEDEDRFRQGLEILREDEDFTLTASFQQIRSAVRDGGIEADFNRGEILKETLGLQQHVFDVLSEKHWTVGIPGKYSGWFVTSDNPLAILVRRPTPGNPLRWEVPPNVYFPISKNLVVLGLEDVKAPRQVLSREQVAVVNFHTAIGSRFVYSPVERFAVTLAGGRTGTGQQLAKEIARAQERAGT